MRQSYSFGVVLPLVFAIMACGSGKDLIDPGPTRYNFGIVDGANQSSTAGAAALPQPITSQLTKDPGGKFATRLKNFVLPVIAFAQGLQMPGTPVAGALVCAREAGPGEPTAFPLCAFTLGNGKAPITIKGGTKAGVHHVVFSAQVPSQEPVKDSTVVTVEAGPATVNAYNEGFTTTGTSPWLVDNNPVDRFVRDTFGNPVPYKLVHTGGLVTVGGDVLGSAAARTLTAVADGVGTVTVTGPSGTLGIGKLTVAGATIRMEFSAP